MQSPKNDGVSVRNLSEMEPSPWFAVQVRARRELGIAEQFRSLGYEWFLPLYKCKKHWSDRTKTVQLPLFPGYIFCRFDPLNRLPILKIPGVIQVVGFNRQPVPVDQNEMRALQILVGSGLDHKPWPYLKIGDRVRIDTGPLRGLEGLLADFQGNRQLVLCVTLLQRAVAVKIDSTSVTLLRQAPEVPEMDRGAISCGI
jgi:transcription antitermination factor NusG